MMQSLRDHQDQLPEPARSKSIQSLAATRNDGKKHLLLAYALPVVDASFGSQSANTRHRASGSVATIKREFLP